MLHDGSYYADWWWNDTNGDSNLLRWYGILCLGDILERRSQLGCYRTHLGHDNTDTIRFISCYFELLRYRVYGAGYGDFHLSMCYYFEFELCTWYVDSNNRRVRWR